VTRLLLLTIALIVYASLYPFHFHGVPGNPLLVLLNSWPAVWDRFAYRDAFVNVAFYAPFGAAATWAWSRRFPGAFAIAPVLLAATALSAAMEMLQVYVPTRVCSLSDVLFNVIGTAGGIAVALAFHPVPAGRQRVDPVRASALMLLALYAGYQLYPFFPVLSHTHLFQEMRDLWAAAGFSPTEVACCAAEWFAALLLVASTLRAARGTALGRMPPALALLSLPLRMVVPTRTLALHEVLGGLLAWLLWTLLRDPLRLRAAVWLVAAAIVLREMAPFHFAATASPFSWIPFAASFGSDRMSALVIVCRKAFDYGAMVWLLREIGVPYWRAGVAVAAALAVFEAIQRYLPGRTPESTDAVLALLLTVVLWSFDNFQRRRGLA
jgi:VanZ family protein